MAGQARQHEIRGAEHRGGETGVEDEPVPQLGQQRKLGELGEVPEREREVEPRREPEGQQAHEDEAERDTAGERGVAAGERAEEVEPDEDDRDDEHEVRDRAERRDPDRHRRADEAAATGEGGRDRQPPERQRGEVVVRDGFAEDLGQQIICGGQGNRHEPQAVEAMHIPGMDDGLERAAYRRTEEHHLRDGVEPGEPERRAEEIPLRGEDILRVADAEGGDGPHADEGVGGEQEEDHEARHLEQLERGGVSREDAGHAEEDPEVPELGGNEKPATVAQRRGGQAGHEPEAEGERGVEAPAVDEGVLRGGRQPAVGEPLAVREEGGRVQLDRGGQLERAAQDEPADGRGEEEEHRPFGGGVDLHLFRAAVMIGGIHRRVTSGRAPARLAPSRARGAGARRRPSGPPSRRWSPPRAPWPGVL